MKKALAAYFQSLKWPAEVALGKQPLTSKGLRENIIDPTVVILKDRTASGIMCGKTAFGLSARYAKHPKIVIACTAAGAIVGFAVGPKAAELVERMSGDFGRAAKPETPALPAPENDNAPLALPAPTAAEKAPVPKDPQL